MKVLSLFDGISCGRVALERAGIPVSRYVAFEIDQNAINCSNWNFPDIEHCGSVVGRDFTEFIGFDIVMGGFPCQDLSIAGKRKGLKGKRSSLFWYLVEAIETVNPRYFLVENNVGMPKEAEDIITDTLGVMPISINSALVSAQTRKRLYWTNIPGVEQPEDRNIFLSDIIKNGYGIHGNKSMALTAIYGGAVIWNSLERKQRTMVAEPIVLYQRPRGYNKGGFTVTEKSPPITVSNWQNNVYIVTDGVISIQNKRGVMPYKISIPDGEYLIRKFTPEECELLQGLPAGYTEMIPKTYRYRTLGNGWNVDTLAHIFNYINIDMLV